MSKTIHAFVLFWTLALCGAEAFAQTPEPVLSMRPFRWYINNEKIPKPGVGVGYEDFMKESSFKPDGWDTPVPFGQTVVRPGTCNQPYTGSDPLFAGTNACQRNAGNFRTFCGFAKMDYADPIVYPNGAGRSHLHTFFGNVGVNAWSTNEGDPKTSISINGNSTCSGGTLNRSSYWVPSFIYHCPTTFVDPDCDYNLDGTPIRPTVLNIYYKGAHGAGSWVNDGTMDNTWTAQNDIVSMPQGFKMIAGNPNATAAQKPPGANYFINIYLCRTGSENDDWTVNGHVPGTGVGATDGCPATNGLGETYYKFRWAISFPSCWDGVNLDSPGHNSHVAYVGDGVGVPCPSGYPYQMVGLSYQLDWVFSTQGHDPVNGLGKADVKYWRLSSDNYPDTEPAGYSGHADWFHGWKQSVMDQWVLECLRPGIDCHDDIIGAHPDNTQTPTMDWTRMRLPRLDKK